MKSNEQISLVRLLKRINVLFKEKDIKGLRRLSDILIQDSSVMQDDYMISLAIVIYTLSKILEKEQFESQSSWSSFYKSILKNLNLLSKNMEKSEFEKYKQNMNNLILEIKRIDMKASTYIEELMKSSKIKKGSNLYGYGLSLGRAAQLLGISKWELMGYLGNVELKEQKSKSINMTSRYDISKKVFNLK